LCWDTRAEVMEKLNRPSDAIFSIRLAIDLEPERQIYRDRMRRLIRRFACDEHFEEPEPTSRDGLFGLKPGDTAESVHEEITKTKIAAQTVVPNELNSVEEAEVFSATIPGSHAVVEVPSTEGGAAFDADSTSPSSQNKQFPDPLLQDNVQFTVYRPKAIRPEKWYTMVAFAHLEERRLGAPESEPDPIEQVGEQAKQILGAQITNYRRNRRQSSLYSSRRGDHFPALCRWYRVQT
jgi:hypothetical protein